MAPLRDLTDGITTVPVEVAVSPLYELLTVAWVLADKEQTGSHEAGSALFDEVTGRMSPEFRGEFEAVSAGCGAVWLGLFPLVADLAPEAGVTDLSDLILERGAAALREQILLLMPHDHHADVSAAAQGDESAYERLEAHTTGSHPEKLERLRAVRVLLDDENEVLLERVTACLIGFYGLVEGHLEAVTPALERDAAGTRGMTLTMPSSRIVERVTKGIEFQLRPGVQRIRLIASSVVRPWTLMLEFGGTQIFVYPVGDEYLDADPDAPPAWLIATYKALADERRLRILRRLASGPATFGDLVAFLGLAKSTVHHHVGVLRSAGLIRVSISDHKDHATYSLRPEVLPEAEHLLGAYLSRKGEA